MARDRAACDKAIREAWKREKQLVLEGKGTRDWTKEQQLDIIELGKTFDEDGIAYEGQHMKSVATYPEHQGNPDNIQLLSHEEHLAAHKGDFHNQTNWYYDPVTSEFNDFGDSGPIACNAIELKQPIAVVRKTKACETLDRTLEEKKGSNSAGTPVSDKTYVSNLSDGRKAYKLKKKQEGRIVNWAERQWEETKRHPLKAVGKATLFVVGTVGVYKAGKALKNYIQSDQVYTIVSSQKKQPRIDHGQVRRVVEEVGNKACESISQNGIPSALTMQALDAGTQAISGLSDYSILLSKGYNTGVSQEARRKILENALAEDGEQSIVRLLRFLINTRSGNKMGKYEKAVAIWKEDLDFVLRNK